MKKALFIIAIGILLPLSSLANDCDLGAELKYFTFPQTHTTVPTYDKWIDVFGRGTRGNNIIADPFEVITVGCDTNNNTEIMIRDSYNSQKYLGAIKSDTPPYNRALIDIGSEAGDEVIFVVNRTGEDKEHATLVNAYRRAEPNVKLHPFYSSESLVSGLVGFIPASKQHAFTHDPNTGFAVTIVSELGLTHYKFLDRIYAETRNDYVMMNKDGTGQLRYATRSDYSYGPHSLGTTGLHKYLWYMRPLNELTYQACNTNPSDAEVVYCKGHQGNPEYTLHKRSGDAFSLQKTATGLYLSYKSSCSDWCVAASESNIYNSTKLLRPSADQAHFLIDEGSKESYLEYHSKTYPITDE